jgi:crotonobetainyl-CoA:carnitine CoA-transferase CaiB-like acyl-CoA transferase
MEELFQVDQFVHRNAFAKIEFSDGTALQAPTIPFRLFQTPPNFGGAVASIGAHTHEFVDHD